MRNAKCVVQGDEMNGAGCVRWDDGGVNARERMLEGGEGRNGVWRMGCRL